MREMRSDSRRLDQSSMRIYEQSMSISSWIDFFWNSSRIALEYLVWNLFGIAWESLFFVDQRLSRDSYSLPCCDDATHFPRFGLWLVAWTAARSLTFKSSAYISLEARTLIFSPLNPLLRARSDCRRLSGSPTDTNRHTTELVQQTNG